MNQLEQFIYNRYKKRRQHISNWELLAEGYVDTHAENQCGAYVRKIGDQRVADEHPEQRAQHSNQALINKDRDGGEKHPDAVCGLSLIHI